MYKKLTGAALGLTLAASLVSPAAAMDFSAIKVKVSNDINKDCMVSGSYDPVWSCFINDFQKKAGYEALVPTPTIYLRPDVPSTLLPYVFLTSVGQYVVMPYSDQELATVFNPAPNQQGFQDVRRAAASSFAFWILGSTMTPTKADFFKAALLK